MKARIWATMVLAVTVSAQAAVAQSAGEKDSKGRVFAKIIVTMTEPNSFGRPVAGLTFLVVTENGDRISVTTDDAGVAGAWLSPASYRFVTPDPVEWQGKTYTWDSILPVKPDSPIIKFSQENASKVVSVASSASPAVQPVQAGYKPPPTNTYQSNPAVPFQYKDGTTATLLSVLITGGGQMYSGDVGKGVTMLLAGVGAVVLGYSASGCDEYGCN
ncbi:MAG TPA: hypothetical protein VF042_13985, partial [Gemmatimonadaceae bacterium]